jgi:hypothetical protein
MSKKAITKVQSIILVVVIVAVIFGGVYYFINEFNQPPPVPHVIEGNEDCSVCHQPGDSGVGEQGGTGQPEDHKERTVDTCLNCHSS